MHNLKSSEDESRTSQSSDDNVQKKADDKDMKLEEPRQWEEIIKYQREMAKGPKNRSKYSALAQTWIAAKVIPAPAPKVYNCEVRMNNLHLFQPRGRLEG